MSHIIGNDQDQHSFSFTYSIIKPFDHLTPLKDHVFENTMENGAFADLEQILHFP